MYNFTKIRDLGLALFSANRWTDVMKL